MLLSMISSFSSEAACSYVTGISSQREIRKQKLEQHMQNITKNYLPAQNIGCFQQLLQVYLRSPWFSCPDLYLQ